MRQQVNEEAVLLLLLLAACQPTGPEYPSRLRRGDDAVRPHHLGRHGVWKRAEIRTAHQLQRHETRDGAAIRVARWEDARINPAQRVCGEAFDPGRFAKRFPILGNVKKSVSPTPKPGASRYRVLRVTRQGGTKLRDALEFADYDAVQIDPVFPAYFADGPDLRPGQYTQMRDRNAAGAYSAILKAAAQQLAPFFVVGGVLVVRLVGPSEVQHEEGSLYGGTSRLRVDSHEWFAEYMRRPVSFGGQIFYPDPQDRTLFHEGAGEQVKVLEPGHPFADYLFHKARYEARLDDDLRAWGNVVVLAENRAGQPVAAEVRVGERGSIVFIWPPQDDQAEELLGEAIAALLDARGGATDGWPLAEDEALDTERELLATRHRTEREELEARRAALRERKRQLFEDRNVTRVIAYWDKVTRAGTGRHDALQELYKLVELITGLYGGEQQTATTLGVPLATVKDIKELANRHEYDVRHAKPGETVQLGDEPFNDALTMGKTLIRAYLDHEFDELRKRAG